MLRALSMLGDAPMPRVLVRRVLKKAVDDRISADFKFLLLLKKELIHNTSLIQDERGNVFNMHRLVRMFVLLEMEISCEEWNSAFRQASISTHRCVSLQHENEGRSFKDLDDHSVFNEHHRTWSSHALAIVSRCSQSYSSANGLRVLDPIHSYAGTVLRSLGRYWDEKKAREGHVKLRQEHYGYNANHPAISNALGNLGIAYRSLGKLNEAKLMQLECLRRKREIYGHDVHNLSIAATLGELSNVFLLLGKLQETLKTLLGCINMYRTILGHNLNHPAVANIFSNLGEVYRTLGM